MANDLQEGKNPRRPYPLQDGCKPYLYTLNIMGYRLHVAKVYKVEYALGDAFNYKCSEFHNFLSACGAEYTGEEWDSDFEVTKEDWQKVIDKLKHLYDLDEDDREEIQGAIDDLGNTTDEVIHMLEYYLREAEPDSDYLHLSFF